MLSNHTNLNGGRGQERRSSPRFRCIREASCKPISLEEEHRWRAGVVNVSNNGIALLIRRQFEPWTVLGVELEGAPERSPCTIQARVVRSVEMSGGGWLVGCALARSLTAEELEALL